MPQIHSWLLLSLGGVVLLACGAPQQLPEPEDAEATVECPPPAEPGDAVEPRPIEVDDRGVLVGVTPTLPRGVGAGPPIDDACACEPADPEPPQTPDAEPCTWRDYGQGLTGGRVNRIQFDPRVPGRVYAMSGDRFYLSVDSGDSWQATSPTPNGLTELAFPGDSTTLLAGSNGGVLRSDDAGASWEPLSLSGLRVASLVAHPGVPQRLFAAIDQLGVLRSEDGGVSWTAANQGVPYGVFTSLGVLPEEPSSALAGFGGVNAAGGADGSGGVMRTDDGGKRWETAFDGMRVHTLAACTRDAHVLWASQLTAGLARSEDGGATWSSVGIDGRVLRVAAAGDDCQTVYAVVHDRGFFRSVDGGGSWQGPLNTGLQMRRPRAESLAVDPQDPSRVLMATHAGGFGSHDGGVTWEPLAGLGRVTVNRVAVSAAAPSRVWLSSWGSGVWKREGSGGLWEWQSGFHDDFALSVAPSPDDTAVVFAGGWPTLEHSMDAGGTFAATDVGDNTVQIAFDPDDPARLMAATQTGGVWRSFDGGATWESANGTFEPWATAAGTFIDTRSLAYADGRVYLGTNGRGLYASDDFGDSWRALAPELSEESVRCLVNTGDALLACVGDLGVFRSDDGETWVEDREGLTSLDVRDFQYDAAQDVLYASTSAGVFLRQSDGPWQPLETECLAEARSLAIVEDGSERLLLAGTSQGISAYPLP